MKISLAVITLAFALAVTNHAHANDSDLDPTFGTGGIALTGLTDASGGGTACGPVLQPDGKILMCGTRLMNGGTVSDFFVARFTAEGQLDPSFSFDGLVTIDFSGASGADTATSLALQADGRVVVVGTTSADNSSGSNNFAIARLTADGELDPTFGTGTGKKIVAFDLDGATGNDNAASVAIQPDGRIVVAGTVATSSHGTDFGVVRLLADGSPDSSFNLTGKVTVGFDLAGSATQNDSAAQVAIDAAGRILIGGSADKGALTTDFDYAVARLMPNGTLDANFNADGRATVSFDLGMSKQDQLMSMMVQANGRIVLGGAVDVSPSATANVDIGVARLLPDGSPDAAFGVAGKTLVTLDLIPNGIDYAFSIIEQPDAKLVFAGGSLYSTTSLAATAIRLLPDGSLDGSFGTLGRRTYDFEQTVPGSQAFLGVALSGSDLIAGGIVLVPGGSGNPIDTFLVRLRNDTIFANGFELIP